MAKTKIEWCDYTKNPVKGLCPTACPYCYARRSYKRFKWDTDLSWDVGALHELPRKPSRIFVGSTMELFGEWIPDRWLNKIFDAVKENPQHTFIFLTKQPQHLIKWSPFPDNCWVGVSVTHNKMLEPALEGLADIQVLKRFISIEPILERIRISEEDCELLDQIIIGQQTPVSAKTQPKIEWIREIVEAADKAGVPVFLKDNLWSVFHGQSCLYDNSWANDRHGALRQEFPKGGE